MRLFNYGKYLEKIEKNAYFNHAKNTIQFAKPRKNGKELNHDEIESYQIEVKDGILDFLFNPSKDIQYVAANIKLKNGAIICHKIPMFVYMEMLEKHLVDDKGYVNSGCLLFLKLKKIKDIIICPKEIGEFEKLPVVSGNSAIPMKDVDENHIYIDSMGKRYFFITKYKAPKLNISKKDETYKDNDGNDEKRMKIDITMNGVEDRYVFVEVEKYSMDFLYFRENEEFFYSSAKKSDDLKDQYDHNRNYLLYDMTKVEFGKPDTCTFDEKTNTLTYTVDHKKYKSNSFINMFDNFYKYFCIECGKNLKECLQISGYWNMLFSDMKKICDLTAEDIGNIYEIVQRKADITNQFIYLGEFASFSFKEKDLNGKKEYSFEPKSSCKKIFIKINERYIGERFRNFYIDKFIDTELLLNAESSYLKDGYYALYVVDGKSEKEISKAFEPRYYSANFWENKFISDSEKQNILKDFVLLRSRKDREDLFERLKNFDCKYDIHQNVKENKLEVARYVEVEEAVKKLLSLPISSTSDGIEMITSATDNIDIILNILENSSIIDLDKEEL